MAIVAFAVALALAGQVTVAPPAEAASHMVRVTGHVSDPKGRPISGILVSAECGCDYPHDEKGGSDRTDSRGDYALTTDKIFVGDTTFSDPKERYFDRGLDPDFGVTRTTTSAGFVIDVTMERVSTISGTVTAVRGARARDAEVTVYDAKTGEEAGWSEVDKAGRYLARVPAGDYKVSFGGGSYYFTSTWYGGGATAAHSPTVSVGYASAVYGIDGLALPKPTISGTFTVDGQPALAKVGEQLRVSLVNGHGVEVSTTDSGTDFSFVELKPGSYTIIARPAEGSSAYVSPLAQKVQLSPESAISGLVINLVSIEPSASSTRSTGIDFEMTSKDYASTGEILSGVITISSYGDVTGGRVVVYIDGKRVDVAKVPSSGRVEFRRRLGVVDPSRFTMKVRFFGTVTSRSRSEYVMGPA